MKVTAITRVFTFDGQEYPDPNPNLNPEQVRGILAAMNPSITSAILEGPSFKNGKEAYSFVQSVGTKG